MTDTSVKPDDVPSDPSASPASTPPSAGASPEAPSAASSVYRRRRVVRNVAVVAAAFAAGYMLLPKVVTPPSSNPLADTAAEPVVTRNLVVEAQSDAVETFATDGTLDGWVPPAPVLGGGAGASAVLSLVVDERCMYAGVVDGQPTAVQVDATGAACDETVVADAVAQLVALQQVTDEVADVAADTPSPAVEAAAATAKFWASRNIDASGNPTFTGLDPALFAPVAVMVEDDGASVLLVDPQLPCPALRVTTDMTVETVACPSGAG